MTSPGTSTLAPPAQGAVRRAPVVLVPLAALACLAVTVAIDRVTPADPRPAGLGAAAFGTLLGLLAAVVLSRRDHRGFGWALAAFALVWGLDGIAEGWVRRGLVTGDALPGASLADWYLYRLTSLLPATVVVIALLFPTGRFLPGRWGLAGRATLGVLLVNTLLFVVVPSGADRLAVDHPPGAEPDLTSVAGLAPIGDALLDVSVVVSILACLVVPVATVVHRYRTSRGLGRQQMRWLLWGALSAALLAVLASLVDLGALEGPTIFVAANLVPVAMTVAVVNPSLVPIEDLLARTLVYGGLALVLVAVDLAVLAGLTALLDDALDQRQVVTVVLLLTVVLYGPLRARLAGWVRRAVLGDRANRYDVVAGLAATLERTGGGSEQLAAVASTVAAAFGVRFVRVEVDRGGGETVVATHGEQPATTRELPITYRGATVGRLVLPARGLRSRLSRRDEELLADVVRQAAIAVRTGRLAEELQESRGRLVVAREEERRRIRRDLHDGLGPALGGAVFRLESARLLVPTDPDAAQEGIAATSRHLQEVVADVRRLVHDLRPPALDDRGLVGALRQQAERAAVSTTVTTGDPGGPAHPDGPRRPDGPADQADQDDQDDQDDCDGSDDLGDLPAAVEVAAYRIVGEALTNVARHARATRAEVRLHREDDALVVTVADDGRGIPATAQAGVGLASLRERADELGGRSEVTCPPSGGTVVRAWLPLPSALPTPEPTEEPA